MTKVLVVDDDPDTRAALSALLRSRAHQVTEAGSGMEALSQLAAGARVDLIVLDLMMPTLSGWELLDELRTQGQFARTPVIIASGVARPPEGVQVAGYVEKPINPDLFLRTIARALDGGGASDVRTPS